MRWKLNTSVYKRVPSRDAAAMDPDLETPDPVAARTPDGGGGATAGPSWRRSLPHVCVATITSFLFGYHAGVVNEPLENISADLGFAGNTLAEGLMVSICLGGAFIRCMFSGCVADGIGRRRAFQLSALPMIMGAALRKCLTTMGSLSVIYAAKIGVCATGLTCKIVGSSQSSWTRPLMFLRASPALQDGMSWRSSVSKIVRIWRRGELTCGLNMVSHLGLNYKMQLITRILVAQIGKL